MGKKGSWFSAIKRVFAHSSKEKVADGTEKKTSKEKKKKGGGKLKHGDGHSFLPFVREPSSIEKILGEVEREHRITNYDPPTPPEQPKAEPPHVTPPPVRTASPPVRTAIPPVRTASPPVRTDTPPRAPTPPKAASPSRDAVPRTPPSRDAVPRTPPSRDAIQPTPLREPTPPARRVASPPRVKTPVNAAAPAKVPSSRFVQQRRPEPTLREQHACATRIQAAYRGYMARRSFRAIRGLVRLQGVMKGHSVKRQTSNALKCMQMLVRVQNQIQSRRIQMLENQVLQRQALYKDDQDQESSFSKWMSENQDQWDDSTLTKEEREARMKRKYDAIVKRERAMAYAYSHQLFKSTPRTANGAIADFRSGGYPYWWNWLEQRQVPPLTPTNRSRSPVIKNFLAIPSKTHKDLSGSSPVPQSSNLGGLGFSNMDTPSPRSSRSMVAPRSRQAKTPPSRFQQKLSRGSAASSPFNGRIFKDDDSLMSCPPFSVPRYMVATASANAKFRGSPVPDSPSSITDEPKRRMSFPFTQGAGSFKWNKGKEPSSPSVSGKNQSVQSIGNLSVDSTVSMPAAVGRKPFNRFV
ncbi:protein IQ-DOMAIN 14 [Spinacia oleracea]|uniref:Protein IQ-DOMAIN 14 n=1 Tax=Spinacia oleracea TaxID=3562 RepID=A0A9R0IAA3_SPIOL|nr:protein IQ-DOMAIN 14 [Spinacia oleracea]XP_021845526.2 protein IQ-DOMAIN 14 [Spinacia oleracea]